MQRDCHFIAIARRFPTPLQPHSRASATATAATTAQLADVANERFDAIVCPGGLPGAQHLAASDTLRAMLVAAKARGALLAAICAAPALVFAAHGLIDATVHATAYPGTAYDAIVSCVKFGKLGVCVYGFLRRSMRRRRHSSLKNHSVFFPVAKSPLHSLHPPSLTALYRQASRFAAQTSPPTHGVR